MVIIRHQCQAKALGGQLSVARANGEMTKVIPDIGSHFIGVGEHECPLEAGDGHIELLGQVTGKAQIVVDLGITGPHLKYAPVIPERYLRLIVIEVVHSYRRNRFDIYGVIIEDLFIETDGILHFVHCLVNSGRVCDQKCFTRVFVQAIAVDVQSGQRLIQPFVDFSQPEVDLNRNLNVFERRSELFLGVSDESQLVIAFP